VVFKTARVDLIRGWVGGLEASFQVFFRDFLFFFEYIHTIHRVFTQCSQQFTRSFTVPSHTRSTYSLWYLGYLRTSSHLYGRVAAAFAAAR